MLERYVYRSSSPRPCSLSFPKQLGGSNSIIPAFRCYRLESSTVSQFNFSKKLFGGMARDNFTRIPHQRDNVFCDINFLEVTSQRVAEMFGRCLGVYVYCFPPGWQCNVWAAMATRLIQEGKALTLLFQVCKIVNILALYTVNENSLPFYFTSIQ